MDELLALADRQHGVVALRQMRRLGISQQAAMRRSETAGWERVTDEVFRRTGSAQGRGQMVMAAVLDAGDGAVLSHESGAAWWRVSGPSLRHLHITRISRSHRSSHLGATVHPVRELPDRWTTVLDCVPVCRPELIALQLFATHPYERAERWVERMWSMRLLCGRSLSGLLADLGRRGRNGVTGVRRYVDDRGAAYTPAASGVESRAIQILRSAGIHVRRQVDVGDDERWTGRVDLAVVDLPVIVEVQSEFHHTALVDARSDDRRIAALRAAGFQVVEVTDSEVWTDPAVVVRRVETAIAAARSVRRSTSKAT